MTFATTYRTVKSDIKSAGFNRVAAALQLQTKNLRNTCSFIIRNIVSAYDPDGNIKADINEHQRTVLTEVNAQVTLINAERTKKHARKLQIDPESTPPVPLKLFGADKDLGAKPFAVLNKTLLDNVLRAHGDQNDQAVYRTIPAVAAQQTIGELIEAYDAYFGALKLYKKSPSSFTGRPQMPGYLARHDRATIAFPAQCLHKKEGVRFPSLAGKTIYTDYAKKDALTEEELSLFDAFDLGKVLNEVKTKRKIAENADLKEVRLVPLPGGRTRLEAVYEIPQPLPKGSIAEAAYSAVYAANPEITDGKINDALITWLKDVPATQLPRMAGIDLGQNNLAAIAFSTGHGGIVISNERIADKLAHFDRKIDTVKSKVMPPELKALQAKREIGKLSPDEIVHFKRLYRDTYQHETYVSLQRERNNWFNDALHKVSCGILKSLVERKISFLAVGLNKGWKQELNMGRKQNRQFLATAHTRLIELLKYKCLAAGILVVTTEESYTSKTSFALNEPLQVKEKNERKTKQDNKALIENMASDMTDSPLMPKESDKPTVKLKGKRGKNERRHFFSSPGAYGAWHTIHADINAAFNMLRKLFNMFAWHDRLHSGFRLHWLSQRCGLKIMRLNCA